MPSRRPTRAGRRKRTNMSNAVRWKRIATVLAVCAAIVTIAVGAGVGASNVGNALRIPERVGMTERQIEELRRAQTEQGQEIRAIRGDIQSLRETITDRGRQTEGQFRDLLSSFAEVRGSIATLVNQVSVHAERIASADKRAQNAEALVDATREEVNDLRVQAAKNHPEKP